MRRSNIEMYVDILKVLAQRGPLKLTHVMYKANMNCKLVTEYLGILKKQGLVEEKKVGRNNIVYAVTSRGISVLKTFKELNEALPIIDDGKILHAEHRIT